MINAWAITTTTKPIKAFITVSLALLIFAASPLDVIYRIPPIIRRIIAAAPAIKVMIWARFNIRPPSPAIGFVAGFLSLQTADVLSWAVLQSTPPKGSKASAYIGTDIKHRSISMDAVSRRRIISARPRILQLLQP